MLRLLIEKKDWQKGRQLSNKKSGDAWLFFLLNFILKRIKTIVPVFVSAS